MVMEGEKVVLRNKRLEDAEDDYRWRTDPELATFDAVPPLRMTFNDFVSLYGDEVRYPTPRQRTYAIDDRETGRHIGNCMFYDIDNYRRQAELGIMIGERDYWSHGYGTDAVISLLRVIFTTAKVDRMYLHTLDWNVRAQQSFKKAGFVPIDTIARRGYTFIVMEIYRSAFEAAASPAEVLPDSTTQNAS